MTQHHDTLSNGHETAAPSTRYSDLRPTLPNGHYGTCLLGAGVEATVWRALHKPTGDIVAVKEFVRGSNGPNEIRWLTELRHPNIVEMLYGPDPDATRQYIVMPVYRKILDYDISERWRALEEAAAGLDYMHQQGVIHRDVKPEHFLVTPDGIGVLGDLALACRADEPEAMRAPGDAQYRAPEVGESGSSPASDIYSFTLAALATVCSLNGTIPNHIDRSLPILAAALSEDPNERPESAVAVIQALSAELRPAGV